MNTKSEDVVSLGADVGGRDADAATRQHVIALSKLLRQKCRGTYSDVIKEFALVLRIDGSVQSWGKCGVENVAFQKKKSFVTADIFVPVDVWSAGDVSELRTFLVDQLVQAIKRIGEEAIRKGVVVDINKFLVDFDNVAIEYLA